MFKNSRKALVVGLATTVAVTGVAVAGPPTGADLNDAKVVAKITPDKLDKKKFKPVALFLGVENSPDATGNALGNAKVELIHTWKNVKINLKKTPICEVDLASGTPRSKDLCKASAGSKGSYIGKGEAEVHAPGSVPACDVSRRD